MTVNNLSNHEEIIRQTQIKVHSKGYLVSTFKDCAGHEKQGKFVCHRPEDTEKTWQLALEVTKLKSLFVCLSLYLFPSLLFSFALQIPVAWASSNLTSFFSTQLRNHYPGSQSRNCPVGKPSQVQKYYLYFLFLIQLSLALSVI